jgi:hypothetical protein
MQTTFNQTISNQYTASSSHTSAWTRFISWCTNQEHNRLMWVGVILAAHGCALTPFTVMATLLTGPNFVLFMTGMVAMGIALVTNLAAMPTKVTIPAFLLSVLIDITVIAACVFKALF